MTLASTQCIKEVHTQEVRKHLFLIYRAYLNTGFIEDVCIISNSKLKDELSIGRNKARYQVPGQVGNFKAVFCLSLKIKKDEGRFKFLKK